ncbi:MAG: FAD-dependent oxidoreductase [Acidimicrobiales bacterium]
MTTSTRPPPGSGAASREQVEFAVIGGGLVGVSVTRALALRGHEVVLLEQSTVGNERAGSKGTTRIFRFGYDDPLYVSMAMASKPMWRELETESGRTLLTDTGQMSFGPDLDLLKAAMAAAGAPFEEIDLAEVRTRAPGLNVADPVGDPAAGESATTVVFEPESGVLAADQCLRALRQSALSAGASIREGSRVVSISEHSERVQLWAESGGDVHDESGGDIDEISASCVIACPGPWTAGLLATIGIGLRLVATLEQAVHLSPITGKWSDVPVFIERQSPWVYGLPAASPGSGLLKVALHHAGPIADPDRTPLDPDPRLIAVIADHAARLLPSYHHEPVSTERCFYDTTPDEDFVLDRIGRVVIGAGTSGHGFKFGPLLGEMLADLALGEEPRYDLQRFSAKRAAVSLGSG